MVFQKTPDVYTRQAGKETETFDIPEKLPKGQDTVLIYIASHGIETKEIREPGQPVRKFVYGQLNSQPFEVECDVPVEVPLAIAQLLKPLVGRH